MLTLLHNAQIRTMARAASQADAAIIAGERFAFVGTEAAARRWLSGRAHRAIDLQGRTMLPGFNDSHMHYLHTVLRSGRVLLEGARSIDDALSMLSDGLTRRTGTWLEADGWNQERFAERRLLTRADLDRVSLEAPIFATRVCGHIAVANTAALRIAGLDIADGILREDEITRVAQHIPAPDQETCLRTMVEGQHALLAQGITSVQSDDVGDMSDEGRAALLEGIRGLTESGALRLRYAAQARMTTQPELERFLSDGLHRLHGKGFGVSCIKLMADGSLGARTAFMRRPYADDASTSGITMYSQAELSGLVATATRHGMPTAIHAIGDGATEQVLSAFETKGGGLRHAIVHAQIMDDAQLARIGALGALVLAQPIFLDADIPVVRVRVGEALANSSYRWRSMLSLGAQVAFGTDCPVESFAPMPNLFCAMARTGPGGGAAFLPEEAFTLEEALHAYTAAGACASGEAEEKGSIEAGKLADFVILAARLSDHSPVQMLQTSVWQTWVGGNCVYQRA